MMKSESYFLIVGSYTEEESDNGVHIFSFDAETVKTELLSSATVMNASYLTVSREPQIIYSISEIEKGLALSFSFNIRNGLLQLLNTSSLEGNEPCYISVDDRRRLAFTANYASGNVSVVRIQADGSLGPLLQTVAHHGSSINSMRQERPHVHSVVLSPEQDVLFARDLGMDEVKAYSINYKSNSPLSALPEACLTVTAGSGPRHLIFHPEMPYAYLTLEMQGAIASLTYQDRRLRVLKYTSLLPTGFQGKVSAADVRISPDGRFLYASSRGDANEVLTFAISVDGSLVLKDRTTEMVVEPRNLAIDPGGRFLLVANQDADNIAIFSRDIQTGRLSFTGKKLDLSKPSCIQIIRKVG